VKGFYSPIDQLAAQLPRTKGTGAEFMTELSKRPGYKPQEAQDRELQTLMALPKMERAKFLEALKAKPPVMPKAVENDGTDDPKYLTPEERNYGGNEGQAFHEQYTLPGGKNYREILLQHPQGQFKGVEGHFGGEPNILASIRVKDRLVPDLEGPHNVKVIEGNRFTNVKHPTREAAERFADVKHQGGYQTEITPLNHKKILHIEEIQSDWHQQGRDKGYLPSDMPKQMAAAKLAHQRLKEQLEYAKSSSSAGERKLKSDMPLYQDPVVRQRVEASIAQDNNSIMDLMPQVMKAEAARQELEQKAKTGVPDAPFKKNWHELALKKMIHHAAANGYDSIAITPGAEQANRYGLAKQVAKLHYNADIKRLRAFNHSGREVISKDMTPDELPQFVGKEVASSLMNTPQEFGVHTLEGQNLNVGGAGMKGFYDKMIPAFLNQFGKKYGAQVQPGSVSIVSTPAQHHGLTESQFQAQSPDEQQRMVRQHAYAHQGAKTEVPVHHFPITPEMREDVVKNGVPLYAKGGKVKPVGYMASGSIEYQGEHKPPSESYGAPLHDLTQAYPEDIYSNKALHYYGMGHPEHKKMDMESLFKAQMYRNKPNASVSIFRAVPEHVNEINPNDWVTLSPAYAKLHGESRLGGKYKTLKKMVKAKELWTAGDSIHEWGYHPEEKKAAGGSIKPVGYTKEKVTVSPNLDQMRYELMSVKRFKKAK
jgi:hypothetical protein